LLITFTCQDASIACYVFDTAHSKGIRNYSVHDCFIAPVAYAHALPEIYVNAFHSLVHPLHLINTLIIQNLFLPLKDDLSELYAWKPSNGIFTTYGEARSEV